MSRDFSCDDCEELLPDYLLGDLNVDEMVTMAAHLRTCLRCQENLLSYENVFADILEIPREHKIPENVWRNIHKSISKEVSKKNAWSFLEEIKEAFSSQWSMALSAISVFVMIGVSLWAFNLQKKTIDLQVRLDMLQEDKKKQYQVSAFLTSPEMRRILLKGEAKAIQATGTILVQPEEIRAILIVQNLPQLPEDRAYQLWLVRNNQRENGGVFRVDSSGMGLIILTAPSPLSTYHAFGITEEPSGGSPGPTSPRLLGGKF